MLLTTWILRVATLSTLESMYVFFFLFLNFKNYIISHLVPTKIQPFQIQSRTPSTSAESSTMILESHSQFLRMVAVKPLSDLKRLTLQHGTILITDRLTMKTQFTSSTGVSDLLALMRILSTVSSSNVT
jgi:hypothetical protein